MCLLIYRVVAKNSIPTKVVHNNGIIDLYIEKTLHTKVHSTLYIGMDNNTIYNIL